MRDSGSEPLPELGNSESSMSGKRRNSSVIQCSGFTVCNGLVTLQESDGDWRRWPEVTRRVNVDGTIESWVPADAKQTRDWKQKIATFLVVESGQVSHAPGQQFILTDFPHDYKLYTHFKGDKANPRKDSYLCGSKYVIYFRSPAEFFYHAKWIRDGCQTDRNGRPLCGCKYCSKADQSEISQQWAHRTPNGMGGGSAKPQQLPTGVVHMKDYTGLAIGVGGAAWRE